MLLESAITSVILLNQFCIIINCENAINIRGGALKDVYASYNCWTFFTVGN